MKEKHVIGLFSFITFVLVIFSFKHLIDNNYGTALNFLGVALLMLSNVFTPNVFLAKLSGSTDLAFTKHSMLILVVAIICFIAAKYS